MNEMMPNPQEEGDAKEQRKQEKIALAQELSERREALPFDGVTPEAFKRIKGEEEEYPGYATPLVTLLERCRTEGIKIVLGAHPESGNVFILPFGSDDIEMDNLFPRHLDLNGPTDENLRKLILLDGNQI